jgi:hypothetical protein
MHYYHHPTCINPNQTWIYDQIPKRVCGQLIGDCGSPAVGWGVHFQEGWNWPKIATLGFWIFVVESPLFGILYAGLKKDLQSAFGIAGYWITTLAVVLGYLAAKESGVKT